ncbi:acyl-CoA dehydrogenase family protein [Hydrogenophaga sp. T2]|uniref:acyl-CoA dehydrogenase family protein n=1 Tax=Hydrogenophaga sp. T2 TaxID=3132823 RepID=UPI003CF1C954
MQNPNPITAVTPAAEDPSDPEAFRAEVRAFCERELPARVRAKVQANLYLEKQDYLDFLHALIPRGWVAGHWPREWGGRGWTPLQRFIFEEESAACGAPWLIPFGVSYVGPVIFTFGSAWQKARFLPPILSSTEWWAQGYSEPGAGSDLAALKTRAVRDGDHYVVTGQKIWTSYVQWADWIFCLVRTSEGTRRQQGISFLLIDMKTPGITVRPIRTMDGCHHVNEVFFDGVRVPVQNLVGEEGQGWTCAKFLLNNERVIAAETGRSIRQLAHLQALVDAEPARPEAGAFRERIAQLRLKLHALRAYCLQAARHMDPTQPAGADASLMKIRGSELQQAIAEATIDWLGPHAAVYDPALVHGDTPRSAVGPLAGPGLVREYLHGRAATIYGGSNEIQRNIIAKAELGL